MARTRKLVLYPTLMDLNADTRTSSTLGYMEIPVDYMVALSGKVIRDLLTDKKHIGKHIAINVPCDLEKEVGFEGTDKVRGILSSPKEYLEKLALEGNAYTPYVIYFRVRKELKDRPKKDSSLDKKLKKNS
ncbi:MAG: hypothetical protein JSW73_00400 [Candidatus Woesearchaeota archaeon]|nr:MAG: hypothetical protein JSW73_00400 [Candidatus Woesearchaeota archaeon]